MRSMLRVIGALFFGSLATALVDAQTAKPTGPTVWDGVFTDPVADGGGIFYTGTSQRVKGVGGIGYNASDYPHTLLAYDQFCGVWGVFITGGGDAWEGTRIGPNPLGAYKLCGGCATAPATVTLV